MATSNKEKPQKKNNHYGKTTWTVAVLLLALAWQSTTSTNVRPTDPDVANLSDRFESLIIDTHTQTKETTTTTTTTTRSGDTNTLSIHVRGYFNWSQNTFLWNWFGEKFGSNPNTPYMYNVLPILGRWLPSFLPSPMWRLRHHDAVVLLAKQPPSVDYFSFTTFCLWSKKRGFVFASLGDSVNSQTIRVDNNTNTNTNTKAQHNNNGGLFAHVVLTQSSRHTLTHIQELLVESGLSADAIHVAVVPDELIDNDSYAFFEVVARLFRFHNQTEGDAYLHSKQPVFYIRGTPPSPEQQQQQQSTLPKPAYKERAHADSVNEHFLQDDFGLFQQNIVAHIADTYQMKLDGTQLQALQEQTTSNDDDKERWIQRIPFGPLYIRGLHCIHNFTECLGDCPDASYFGSHIRDDTDIIPALTLKGNDELHVMAMVDHRRTKASTYSSVALLTSPDGAILNKSHMNVYGTSMGVLSNVDFHDHLFSAATTNNNHGAPFMAWIFTRNPDHCTTLSQFVQGCTVLEEREVARHEYFAYCERLYLNPVTGTGPDWNNIVPAQLYHLRELNQPPKVNEEAAARYKQQNAELFAQLRLPSSNVPLTVFQGEEQLRFLHIVKTGGEAFEGYLHASPNGVPKMDYKTCRGTSMASLTTSGSAIASTPCWALATAISSILCGFNCECCAADMHEEGRFHGTFLRSPRAHTLSLFSHGHNAHHTTWERMAADKTNYLAEGVLRGSEHICGHSGTDGVEDWKIAFEDTLKTSLASWPPNGASEWDDGVQVISLRNVQSHALTCGKKEKGSLGQHFRVLAQPKQPGTNSLPSAVDSLEPNLEEALEALRRMEWIGITDLYHPSLCLLHYQANQTLSAKDCDCRHKHHHTNDETTKPLGYWVEYRNKRRSLGDLSSNLVDMIDAHTSVDEKLFGEALRLMLGRLRRVEEITGTPLLECIDWQKLKQKTDYIPGLWTGGPDSLLSDRDGEDTEETE
jgi:hypothetical protein